MTTLQAELTELVMLERWVGVMTQQHPQIPEALIRLYAEDERCPDAEAIAAALGCETAQAEDWRKVLEAHLLSPAYYTEVFAAEDHVSERRMQQQRYQDDCRATAQRLTELQREIEGTKAYAHLGEEQAAEVRDKIELLDQERVDLLRHQGDLPGVGRQIDAALEAVHVVLGEAQAALEQAQVDHLQDVETAWLQEAIALCEPLRHLLRLAQYLDERWEAVGVTPGLEHGRRRILEAVQSALRR
jgi:hypothetical protein